MKNIEKPVEQLIIEYHKKVRDFVEAKILETCGGKLGREILKQSRNFGEEKDEE